MYRNKDLFDLTHTYREAAEKLGTLDYPWEILPEIGELIMKIGAGLSEDAFDHPSENVWIAKDAVIYPNNYIAGPAIIGHGTEVRPGAFIRGNALVGDNVVVGNSTELKNVILFDRVEVPHFNYVGDSVLGFRAHLGAGAVTSNVRADRLNVNIKDSGSLLETGRRKVGAFLGDFAEIGCNAVLNPGTVVGRHAMVYPTSCVRGTVKENGIFKNNGEISEKSC